jgi:DNA-directed RNA polymerase subunit RPC12/RpoP
VGHRLASSCPACGAPIGIDAAETAARCDRCGNAHLVLRGSGTTVAEIASRTSEEEARALACAALEGEMLRRGRTGPGPVVDSVRSFVAPVRVLVARLHEAAVVRGADGHPEAEVTTRWTEVARPALRDSLGLPTAPPIGEVDARSLTVVSCRTVSAPPFDAGEDGWATDGKRLEAAHAGVAPPLARHTVAFPLARLLVLRPCRLVSVSAGRARAGVLVDDADRQATAILSHAAFEALDSEIAHRPLPVSPPPALRPMRCPECASPFPLDRQGQLRICPACRRAFLIAGRRLLPVRYTAELPPSPRGRVLVPAWRLTFVLQDPRDGRELPSVAAVRSRCGEDGVTGNDEAVPLDVPAFLPADRRRERRGTQALPSLPGAVLPICEGPARTEAGFPEPRLVGALGPLEAACIVRHVLLGALRPETVASASAGRLKALLFDAPLRVGPPTLVLRSLRRAEVDSA